MRKLNVFRLQIEQPSDSSSRHIALTRGKFVIVDAADYEWLMQWNWYAYRVRKSELYYAARFEGRTIIFMHRQLTPSELPEVDHINRNGLDNRRSNLRPCTRADNQANRTMDKRNTSGYKGVSWSKSYGKWQAQTSVGGKHIHLGFRDDPKDAHNLYSDFVLSVKGKFSRY